jgi:hypothetical protein
MKRLFEQRTYFNEVTTPRQDSDDLDGNLQRL